MILFQVIRWCHYNNMTILNYFPWLMNQFRVICNRIWIAHKNKVLWTKISARALEFASTAFKSYRTMSYMSAILKLVTSPSETAFQLKLTRFLHDYVMDLFYIFFCLSSQIINAYLKYSLLCNVMFKII